MTTFALLVLGSPQSSQSVDTAYAFAEAALAAGHRILRVFFFHDGVHCGNRLAVGSGGETPAHQRWTALAANHGIDLVVCVASALKRGVLDDAEAKRQGKGTGNLAQGFELSGLGQWIEACMTAERVVTFGP